MGMKPARVVTSTLPPMQEPISPSGEQVELSVGDQRVVVVGFGGGLRRYSVGDESVLDGYSVVTMCGSAR